jgi:hypothetical protein
VRPTLLLLVFLLQFNTSASGLLLLPHSVDVSVLHLADHFVSTIDAFSSALGTS